MAAYREGMKTVLIPKENKSDLYEVDPLVKEKIHFIPVANLQQVLKLALIPVEGDVKPAAHQAEEGHAAKTTVPAEKSSAVLRQ